MQVRQTADMVDMAMGEEQQLEIFGQHAQSCAMPQGAVA
jgi:hypothetical protein